jgi:hypothetical protein
MEHGQILLYVLTMLFGVGLFVALQSYVVGMNMTTWSFQGASFVKLVIPILPTIFLICIIVIPVYFIMEAAD